MVTSHRRRCSRITMLALVSVLIAACGGTGPSGAATDLEPVRTVRTDPDGQGFLATSIGRCGQSASLRADETLDQVDVHIVVEDGPTPGVCAAAGTIETLHTRLAAPIGARTLLTAGVPLEPFDGALLRDPSGLPPGYAVVFEDAGAVVSVPGQDPSRPVTWSRFYDAPPQGAAGCAAARGAVEISQGPVDAQIHDYGMEAGQPVQRNGIAFDVRSDDANRRRTVGFRDGAGAVSVVNQSSCTGDVLLTEDELVELAASLARP